MQNFTDVHLGSSVKDTLIFMNVPLSVGYGSHNKTLHTGWLNQQEFAFPQFWRLEGSDQGSAGLLS